MINEAIILAGGLGTRLRDVTGDLPKCMAPVNGIPFIHFIVAHLKNKGIEKFIFSLGYKHETITGYLEKTFEEIDKKYVIETNLLGTGGAIQNAGNYSESENVIVLNGDTLFNIDFGRLSDFHNSSNACCSVALKEMKDFSRYGSVEISSNGEIKAFHEKRACEKGYINGGVYTIKMPVFLQEGLPEIFSFENDWLEKKAGTGEVYGDVFDNYFIDIGIPGDYRRFWEDYNFILPKAGNGGYPGNKDGFDLENFFKLIG